MPRYNAVFASGPVKKPVKQFVYFNSPDDAAAQAFAARLDPLIVGSLLGVNKQIVENAYGVEVPLEANENGVRVLFKGGTDGDSLTQVRYWHGDATKSNLDIEAAMRAAVTAGELETREAANIGEFLRVTITES
jgi:hypothetical protein